MATDETVPPRVAAAEHRRRFRLLLSESSADPAYDPYGVLPDVDEAAPVVRQCETVGELIRENFLYLLDRGELDTLRRLLAEAAEEYDELALPAAVDPMTGEAIMTKPEVLAAAEWWAQKLAGEPGWQETGEAGLSYETSLAARMVRRRTPTEVAAFRVALVETLDRHVSPHWDPSKDPQWGSGLRAVQVDYGPDEPLADAAEAAGLGKLGTGELPVKTVMWINPGLVTVREGYGGPQLLVWSPSDWERPACGENRREGDFRGYQVFNEVCARLVYHAGEHGDWMPDAKRCWACGGTFVDHQSQESWARPDRCNHWYHEDPS